MADQSAAGAAAAAVLANPKRREIAVLLGAAPDGLTVARIAQLMDLHHNAVRRHLRTLAGAGVISATPEAPSGRGRPGVRYHLASSAVGVAEAHQELVRMLVGLVRRLDADDAVVERFSREHGATMLTDSGRGAVIAAMGRLGFAPADTTGATDAARGELHLRLDHCPFREAVLAPGGAAVCVLHRGLLAGMAGAAAPTGCLVEMVARDPRTAGCTVHMTGLPAGTRAAA